MKHNFLFWKRERKAKVEKERPKFFVGKEPLVDGYVEVKADDLGGWAVCISPFFHGGLKIDTSRLAADICTMLNSGKYDREG